MPGTDRVLLGVITPSSNTRLEPLTVRILRDLPDVTAHFSRFRVVDVGLDAVGQFESAPILDAVERADIRSLGLVTPYPDDMHDAVARTLSAAGATVTVSRNYSVTTSNWELSSVGEDVLSALVRSVASGSPDAITTFCTNLAAADLVSGWEADLGIPVFDSVALAVWRVLELAGVDAARVTGWGRLFGLPRPSSTHPGQGVSRPDGWR